MRFVKGDQNYTVRDVTSDDLRQNISNVDNGYFFYKKLRNSPSYLKKKKKETSLL